MLKKQYDEMVTVKPETNMTWISNDQATWGIILNDWIESIEPSIKFLRERGVLKNGSVVQAGGHCGMYPLLFAGYFDMVFTFEPNALNFHCLVQNCQGDNIIKMNLALGVGPGRVKSFVVNQYNTGMNKVIDASTERQYVPVIALDSLALADIAFIELDLEGYELNALVGAKETIKNNSPILLIENADEPIKQFLDDLGYVEWKKINRLDSVFVKREDLEKLDGICD